MDTRPELPEVQGKTIWFYTQPLRSSASLNTSWTQTKSTAVTFRTSSSWRATMILYGVRSATALSDTRFYYPLAWTKRTWDLHQCSLQPLVHKLSSCQTHHGCRKRWQERPDDAETTMTRSSKFLPLPFVWQFDSTKYWSKPGVCHPFLLPSPLAIILSGYLLFLLLLLCLLPFGCFFRLMMFLTLHQPHSNSKLKTLLRGTTIIHYFHGTTLSGHIQFSQPFYFQNTVYIRFTHKRTDQPRFYIGSTTNKTFDREPIRFRKFKQVQQGQLVLSEVAVLGSQPAASDSSSGVSYPHIPKNPDTAWALDQTLIQLWQLPLNFPFICQHFTPRKGIKKCNHFQTAASSP